jgi:signal transduction histidine kinase/CheY-like chemotaxis protein
MEALVCTTDDELARELEQDAGALLITSEAFVPAAAAAVLQTVSEQPQWSDLPIVLLADRDDSTSRKAGTGGLLRSAANVTVLERPVRGLTLVTAMHSALRARHRQYEVRDLVLRERSARRDAESASLVKDEFLATVSHELRTPLNAILLWSQLLSSGVVGPEKATAGLRSIEESAKAQSKLIEDLLDVSRMIGGKLKVNLQTIDLRPVIEAAIDVVRPSAHSKSQKLETIIETVAPVRADSDRLQQIIWNLLSNAIKFTPREGRVSIHLTEIDGHARIVVRDTGKGINSQFLPHVFERFRQADASPRRLQSGLGLGLAITRQLVELHGGSIQAESDGDGMGSTFTVELPLARCETDTAQQIAGVSIGDSALGNSGRSLTGLWVLLVEDDAATREAMTYTLSECEALVTALPTAAAALEWLAERSADHWPDILLSDLGLPGMDGHELLRQVRGFERMHGLPPLPALLITAYARVEDRRRALEVGFTECIAKPLEPGRLVRVVAEIAAKIPELPPLEVKSESRGADHPRRP